MADRAISTLTELQSPAADDVFIVVDADEAVSADKNKKLKFGVLHKAAPDGSATAPAISFLTDSSRTGFYRSGTDELAVTANSSYVAKFTTAGFQLGTGTAAAQLHLFSTDTTDQVIIENSDADLDTAPDVVLYRNSATPAATDNLGNLEFRGNNSANESVVYGQILAQVNSPTDTSESGILQLITSAAGTNAARVTIKANKVGINEANPQHSLHVTESVQSTGLFVESSDATAVSAADITLYHHRGSTTAALANDVLSSIKFQGNNDASTPEQVVYAKIETAVIDAGDTTEDGKIDLKVQSAGTLTSMAAITAANVTLGARPIIPTLTPASATATGTAGEVAWDANYVYVCVATNTWKRVAIATWS